MLELATLITRHARLRPGATAVVFGAARHPAVREVAVFGVPHEKWCETPVAAVVLRARLGHGRRAA